MIRKVLNILSFYWHRRSRKVYLDYLRSKGITIGVGTVCKDPLTIHIDITRPELIEIGNHVFLHKGTTILSHDWASWCFIYKYHDFIPSHKRIKIGNNIWFGESCTILKGVTIGDNCIIGIGSIVTKDIPANSVAVGSPAKVICTIDEYYNKRKNEYLNEAIEYAQLIKTKGRMPQKEDFYDDYPAFVDKSNFMKYSNYPYLHVFENYDILEKWKKHHQAPCKDWDDFLRLADIKE